MFFTTKYFYSFCGFLIIFSLFYFRIRAIFREPILISFPLYNNIIWLLLFLLILFVFVLLFSLVSFPIKALNNFYFQKIINILDKFILSIKELHHILSRSVKTYGTVCNFFNTMFQYTGICKYPFIFILFFS